MLSSLWPCLGAGLHCRIFSQHYPPLVLHQPLLEVLHPHLTFGPLTSEESPLCRSLHAFILVKTLHREKSEHTKVHIFTHIQAIISNIHCLSTEQLKPIVFLVESSNFFLVLSEICRKDSFKELELHSEHVEPTQYFVLLSLTDNIR